MSSDDNEDSFEGRPKKISRKWTEQEVQDLLAGVAAARAENTDCEMSDLNWQEIARSVPGRTAKQCREKYKNDLRDGLFKASWTRREEYIIARVHAVVGNQWSEIARYLPGRSENSIKNFFNSTLRSKVTSRSRSFLAMYGRMSVELGHSLEVFNQAREVYTREEGDTEPLTDFEVSEEVFVMNPPQIQTQFRGNRPKGPVQINARSTSRISGGKHALEDPEAGDGSGDEQYGTTSRRLSQGGSYTVIGTHRSKRIKIRTPSTAPTSSGATAPAAAAAPATANVTPPRTSAAGPQASGVVQQQSATAQQQGSMTAQQGSIQQPVQEADIKDDEVFQETKHLNTNKHKANVFKGIPTPQDLMHFQMQAMNDWLQEVMPKHQNAAGPLGNHSLLFQSDLVNDQYGADVTLGLQSGMNPDPQYNQSQQATVPPSGPVHEENLPKGPSVPSPQANAGLHSQQDTMPDNHCADNSDNPVCAPDQLTNDMMPGMTQPDRSNLAQPGSRRNSMDAHGYGNVHGQHGAAYPTVHLDKPHPPSYGAHSRGSSAGGSHCQTPHDAFATITLPGQQQHGAYPYPHPKAYRHIMYIDCYGMPPPENPAMHFHSNFAQALHGHGPGMYPGGMLHPTHAYPHQQPQQQQQRARQDMPGWFRSRNVKDHCENLEHPDAKDSRAKDKVEVECGRPEANRMPVPPPLNSPSLSFPADGMDSLFSPDELAFLGGLLDADDLPGATPKTCTLPTATQLQKQVTRTHGHELQHMRQRPHVPIRSEPSPGDARMMRHGRAAAAAAADTATRHDANSVQNMSEITLIPGNAQTRPGAQATAESSHNMKRQSHDQQGDNFRPEIQAMPNAGLVFAAQETDVAVDAGISNGCSTGHSSAVYKAGRRGIAGAGTALPPSFNELLPPIASMHVHTSPVEVTRIPSNRMDSVLPSLGSLSAPNLTHASMQGSGNAPDHVNLRLPAADGPVMSPYPDIVGGSGMMHGDLGMPGFALPYPPSPWLAGCPPGMMMKMPHKQRKSRGQFQPGMAQQDSMLPRQPYQGMAPDMFHGNFNMKPNADLLDMQHYAFPMPASLPSIAPPLSSGLSSRGMR